MPRITAANCLAEHFADSEQARDGFRHDAIAGENVEVRCRCVTLLGLIGSISSLVRQAIDDRKAELRLYAVEYMLVNHTQNSPMQKRLCQPCDWRIVETLDCFRTAIARVSTLSI